jgi:TatA/E family protein of Tat protein translocase
VIFDLGPEKLLVLLAIVLVVTGPKSLPEVARSLGRAIREFRRSASETEPADADERSPLPADPARVTTPQDDDRTEIGGER